MHSLKINQQLHSLKKIVAIPEGFDVVKLEDSELFFVKCQWGKVLFQKVTTTSFEIWQGYYQLTRPAQIGFIMRRPFIGIHITISGGQSCQINDGSIVPFRENEFNIVLLPRIQVTVELPSAFQYASLDILFTPGMLFPYASTLPVLQAMLDDHTERKPCMLNRVPLPVTSHESPIVRNILHPDAEGHWQLPYLDNQCALLVQRCLSTYEKWVGGHTRLLGPVAIKMLEAKELIESNFSEHFTIVQLARKAGMNTMSFKASFKLQFGVAPYTFLQNLRMKKARELLEQAGMQVGEVAEACGYKNTGSFIKVFKRHFKRTPGSIKNISR